MAHLRNLKDTASVFDVLLTLPDLYEPFADFCQRLFRGPGALSVQERELIFAYVSNLNHCEYCFGGHSQTAILFGADPVTFDKLRENIDSAPVSDRLKPLLHYVKKLTETPARMIPADADRVYAAGWGDAAFHQAITIACLANFMNRLVDGTGVKADPAKFGLRAKMASDKGYYQPFLDRLAALAKKTG